jgi:hypothetical protein
MSSPGGSNGLTSPPRQTAGEYAGKALASFIDDFLLKHPGRLPLGIHLGIVLWGGMQFLQFAYGSSFANFKSLTIAPCLALGILIIHALAEIRLSIAISRGSNEISRAVAFLNAAPLSDAELREKWRALVDKVIEDIPAASDRREGENQHSAKPV